MTACAACGAQTASFDRFCNECGHSQPEQSAPDALGPAARPSGSISAAPPALLLACALMAAMGAYLLFLSLSGFADGWNLLSGGGDFWVFGVVVLSAILVTGALAVALVAIAWRLTTGDRVARGLAYVLLAVTAAIVLFGQDFSVAPMLVLVGALGLIALLALIPQVNEYFALHHGDQVVPVVVAQTLLVWWAFMVTLFGLSALPLAAIDGGAALVGGVSILIGIGALVIGRGLGERDRTARVATTVGAAVYVALILLTGEGGARVIPIVFAAGIVGLLWVPQDSRLHFGDIHTPGAVPSGMPCPACGEAVASGDTYCGRCGRRMSSLPHATDAPVQSRSTLPASEASAAKRTRSSPTHDSSAQGTARPAETLMLLGPAGTPVAWPQLALIGRNPSAGRGDRPDALLVRVDDPECMVSKTHAAVGLDSTGPWVVDRSSTNGTEVVSEGAAPRRLEPGVRTHLRVGDIVLLGGGSQRVEVGLKRGNGPGGG